MTALTGLWALVELVHEGERVLDNIQDGQQSACETQQLTEAIETKVHQVTSQIHHLEGRSKTSTSRLKTCEKINVVMSESTINMCTVSSLFHL